MSERIKVKGTQQQFFSGQRNRSVEMVQPYRVINLVDVVRLKDVESLNAFIDEHGPEAEYVHVPSTGLVKINEENTPGGLRIFLVEFWGKYQQIQKDKGEAEDKINDL